MMTTRHGAGRRALQAAVAAIALTAATPALSQSAAPGAAVALDPVTVEGTAGGVPAAVQERFDALPGGVAVVPHEDYADTANPTLSRALATVPGVVVQDFFGGNDQPRVQIRGSGLQQNPAERGVLMLQDGLPINRADGSYVVGFANPAQADMIEVYRGYMANRLGATVLGGALNLVSPTGSGLQGMRFSASGGSFGQADLSGQAGMRHGAVDGLFQFDVNRRDGYRTYNKSERVSVGGNVGVAWSDRVVTRFFAGYTDLGFDVAGPLTKAAMNADPRQVSTGPLVTPAGAINPGPNVVRDRPRREATQFLVGTRTTARFDNHLLDFAVGYTYTDDTFRFPVSAGIRTTKGGDGTALVRYAYDNGTAPLPLFEALAQYSTGSADRGYFLNQRGQNIGRFGDNRLDSTTLSLYSGFNIPLIDRLTLSPSLSYAYATRDNDDRYSAATRPTIAFNPANPNVALPNGAVRSQDTTYSRSYQGWNPSLALSFRPVPDQTVFAAVSRSFEPPTQDDLLATVNGTPNSSPGRPNPATPLAQAAAFSTPNLKAQTATTVEGGWRGKWNRLSWDAVSYYSWVDNELLSLRDATGASLGAVNAGRTTHFGIELGLSAWLTDKLSGRIAYTYQDYRFVNDPVRGNNRLAGVPPHYFATTVQYQATDRWKVGGTLRGSPASTPVDNMNTLYASPWAVLDLRTDFQINDTFKVFGELTNLFDKTYASSTLIVDQARPDQAAFLPGDGRAVYAGIKAKF